VTGLIPGLPPPRGVRIMSCIGPMARTVETRYRCLAGPNDIPEVALRNLRVTFAPTFPGFPVAADIRNTVEELATQLQPLCAKVAESTPSTLDISRELPGAAELIAMMIAGPPSESNEQPTALTVF